MASTVSHNFPSERAPAAVRERLHEEVIPYLVAQKFQIAGQNEEAIRLERRYLPWWGLVIGILTFPLGILAWALIRSAYTITFSIFARDAGSRVMIVGTAPPLVREYLEEIPGSGQSDTPPVPG